MKRNTDNYNEGVLNQVEGYILDRGGTLQEAANMTGLSSGRLSYHMRKRGLVFDRKENKWSKPSTEKTFIGMMQSNGEFVPASTLTPVIPWPYNNPPVDLENYAAEFDRYTAVLEQSAIALQVVVEQRDQLRKDNAELTAALHDITKRYEDQGRELLIARQDQEKWHSEKYRHDLAKIETTRKINKGIIDRTLEFIDRSQS